MDTRNVIAAISLSAAVIILYGLFFAPPSPDPKQVNNNDQNKNNLQPPSFSVPSIYFFSTYLL